MLETVARPMWLSGIKNADAILAHHTDLVTHMLQIRLRGRLDLTDHIEAVGPHPTRLRTSVPNRPRMATPLLQRCRVNREPPRVLAAETGPDRFDYVIVLPPMDHDVERVPTRPDAAFHDATATRSYHPEFVVPSVGLGHVLVDLPQTADARAAITDAAARKRTQAYRRLIAHAAGGSRHDAVHQHCPADATPNAASALGRCLSSVPEHPAEGPAECPPPPVARQMMKSTAQDAP